jgi:hypothetical protein
MKFEICVAQVEYMMGNQHFAESHIKDCIRQSNELIAASVNNPEQPFKDLVPLRELADKLSEQIEIAVIQMDFRRPLDMGTSSDRNDSTPNIDHQLNKYVNMMMENTNKITPESQAGEDDKDKSKKNFSTDVDYATYLALLRATRPAEEQEAPQFLVDPVPRTLHAPSSRPRTPRTSRKRRRKSPSHTE